jgi:hypothetical protein
LRSTRKLSLLIGATALLLVAGATAGPAVANTDPVNPTLSAAKVFPDTDFL